MPWAKLSEPSLGLGILKALLDRAEVPSRVMHLNLKLLRYLKHHSYLGLGDLIGLNEFLFTGELAEGVAPEQVSRLVERAKDVGGTHSRLKDYFETPAAYVDYFLEVRERAIPPFLDDCAELVLAENPTLVGFTCLFDQTIASLALAKRLKEHQPELRIAFGGYALEGEPGLEILRRFPWVDAVAFGDGEACMVPLARWSAGEAALDEIPNVAFADGGGGVTESPRVRIPIELSPDPVYGDYFGDLRELAAEDHVHIEPRVIPIETSRGCWWGEKHHCVFCGIDDETLSYRERSPENAKALIDRMKAMYPGKVLRLVDYILPHRYFTTLLPALADDGGSVSLTCESKANLSEEKVVALRRAGFIAVQPGIESFSTPVLRRMRKGVTGIQNVLTLKLGKKHGIRIDWNLLYGFPDDVEEEYQELVRIVPHLYHLDPPYNHSEIFLTRFAPLHSDPAAFGLPEAVHHDVYRLWFPDGYLEETGLDLDRICYFFERTWTNPPSLRTLYRVLDVQAAHWREVAGTGEVFLHHWVEDGALKVADGRGYPASVRILEVDPRGEEILAFMDGQVRTDAEVAARFGGVMGEGALADVLRTLEEERVIFREGNRLLSLSFTASPAEREAASRLSKRYAAIL